MSTDECCAVCAEPLEWTGVGECGHMETCSKCVARWRFVLKDNSCMMCKQEQKSLYFTRYMGDYTKRPESFSDLQARANRGELYHLADIAGFFDDSTHFQLIKGLCGYTHPFISEKCAEAGREVPVFTSINGMKKFVDMHYKMNFCDICITSRQVFLCEQLLYNKADLDKHMRSGDETGPLAGTSFKGHPLCKFCRKRFYDSNDLYKHMETGHEHCFLCRRANPSQYVYYKHYAELEEHFHTDHHPCPHPTCLERKFVVFMSEHELKRHFASEHGDEVKMSRAQRREAMTIPISLQYRDSGAAGSSSGPIMHDLDRPGVVIGGGMQFPSRHGRNNPQRQGRESNASPEPSSYHTTDQAPSSITFSAEDFPQATASANGVNLLTSRWGGNVPGWEAGGGTTSAAGGGAGPSGGFSHDHFPALPTMSKAAKKKLRAQQAAAGASAGGSLADQLRAVNMPVRVISRATGNGARGGAGGGASTSSAAASSSSQLRPPMSEPDPPPPAQAAVASALGGLSGPGSAVATALPSARTPTPQPTIAPTVPEPVPVPVPEPAPPTYRPAHATIAAIAAAGANAASSSPARALSTPSRLADEFPSLPTAAPVPARPPPAPAAPCFVNAATFGGLASSSSRATSSSSAAPPPDLKAADFPSLSSPAVAKKGGKSNKGKALTLSASSSSGSLSAWTPAASTSTASAVRSSPPVAAEPAPSSSAASNGHGSPISSTSGSSVSKELQQANRTLVSKIQAQLADDGKFTKFKQQSVAFQRGEVSASEYHDHVIQMGLMALVPELAALCPAAEKRDGLLAAHKAYLTSPAAQQVMPGWLPPEAAIAATEQVQARTSWTCSICTLANAPDVMVCEACGGLRPGVTPKLDPFPSLAAVYSGGRGGPSASGASTSAGASSGTAMGPSLNAADESGLSTGTSGGKGKKGKGGTKITIGMGAGTARPGPSGNAWGGNTGSNDQLRAQVDQARQLLANKGPGKGQWAAAGGSKVARMHSALNDAWGE